MMPRQDVKLARSSSGADVSATSAPWPISHARAREETNVRNTPTQSPMVPPPQQSSASRSGVQNVHVMRAEVRADYGGALEHLDGDEPFHARFARFFTELRDPLVAVYGDDPRSPPWRRLLDAIARPPRRARPSAPLDHEREITPDWLQREQAVGYVAYVDRFAGTLTESASGSRTSASSASPTCT